MQGGPVRLWPFRRRAFDTTIKESVWAFQQLMTAAQGEIDRGERAGARRIWKTANPAKVTIGWFERRVLRGEFKRTAK